LLRIIFSAFERFIFDKIFLRLALLLEFIFHPKINESREGIINFSTA
jgi:hypothetical protein